MESGAVKSGGERMPYRPPEPPPGVVVPPGTPVPPFGVVVDVVELVVVALVVVGSLRVASPGPLVVVALPESPESSPATMISATPRPITRESRTPMIQRVRESTERL
jgi:hypothetical protein